MVALSGTATDRKTIVSSNSDRPTTNNPNGISAALSRSEIST